MLCLQSKLQARPRKQENVISTLHIFVEMLAGIAKIAYLCRKSYKIF